MCVGGHLGFLCDNIVFDRDFSYALMQPYTKREIVTLLIYSFFVIKLIRQTGGWMDRYSTPSSLCDGGQKPLLKCRKYIYGIYIFFFHNLKSTVQKSSCHNEMFTEKLCCDVVNHEVSVRSGTNSWLKTATQSQPLSFGLPSILQVILSSRQAAEPRSDCLIWVQLTGNYTITSGWEELKWQVHRSVPPGDPTFLNASFFVCLCIYGTFRLKCSLNLTDSLFWMCYPFVVGLAGKICQVLIYFFLAIT